MQIDLSIDPMLLIAASAALWACGGHITGLGKAGKYAVVAFAITLGVVAFATVIASVIG